LIVDTSTARARYGERSDVLALVRRLDWLLLAAVGALVAYGIWRRIRRTISKTRRCA
jgi:hypothetical protein